MYHMIMRSRHAGPRRHGAGLPRAAALAFALLLASAFPPGAAAQARDAASNGAAATTAIGAGAGAGMRLAAASTARSETAAEPFWEALRLDDVKGLQTQMLRGAGANAVHPEFGPAIVFAARERSPKALAYLARLPGTRVDATNASNETALMLVALQGDLDSARVLVERGAQVNRPGWAPLHYAAAAGHLQTIEFLLEQSAYIDAESPNRTTPLMMAARHKHTNAVQLLVDAGADPTLRNEAGYTAADYLAAHGEHAEAGRLREHAAEFARKYRAPAKAGGAENANREGFGLAEPATDPAASGAAGVTTSPVPPRPSLPGSRD